MNQTPNFNLKVVIRETGLKPDTIRAWERRYGLPKPERTSGGHRIYSQRDIDTLKWLVARQKEGLSISRAVSLWRQLEDDGHDPLKEPSYAKPDRIPTPTFVPQGEAVADLKQAWLSACLAFDEPQAEQVLSYALALYPAEAVCFEILLKSLAEIGEGWYRGQVTVQQEHFASELATRRLEAMISATPAPTRPSRLLCGCAPEDAHIFAPLLLTFLLRQRGWEVVYLGASVPTERLAATVATIQPQMVILTAQLLHTAATLRAAAELLVRERTPLAFGGRIFNVLPELRQLIPGHFLGERLETALPAIEQLLASPVPIPPTKSIPEIYRVALGDFRERRNLIEAETWRTPELKDLAPAHLSIASQMLARNITAALTLGDINLLRADIQWIESLLENHRMPRDMLRRYLSAYYQAAQTHLSQDGQIVVNWLAQFNVNNTKQSD